MMTSLILIFSILLGSTFGQSAPPCPQPEPIDHGTAVWNGTSKTARYACFQGYHLVGPPLVECRYGGWYSDSPATKPTCKPIVCNQPTIINGRLDSGDSMRYRAGQEASVSCDEGYELRNGFGKIVCKEDGSWEGTQQKEFPSCKEKTCPYPDNSIPVIEDGSLEINGNRQGGYKPGSVALYHCNPGFVLLPLSAGKRVCRRGLWEGTIPACVPQSQQSPLRNHCPAPASISNGYYLTDRQSETPLALPAVSLGGEQYEFGTIARYHCQEGYSLRRLHGQDIYRCTLNGEWTPKIPPVCVKLEQITLSDPLEEVMCPSPPAIAHTDFERMEGWLTSNGALHGTILEYTCRVGYRDSRTPCLPTRRTCHAGKWVGNMPSCVPFDYCERPPSISHGFMSTPPENVYRILFEVLYECHPGYRMKGTSSLRCAATGCWTPNELPQCIREDLYESSWNSSDETRVPLLAVLSIVSVGCAVVAILTTGCLVIVCRRKGGHVPPPAGPAHWSTTVTVTPECRPPREPLPPRRQEQDRMALIAFADGVQQVTLPSYEEALRDSSHGGPLPLTSSANPAAATTSLGSSSRHAANFDMVGGPESMIGGSNGGHHINGMANERALLAASHHAMSPSGVVVGLNGGSGNGGLISNGNGVNGHAPNSPYRSHGMNDVPSSSTLHVNGRHHNVRQGGTRGSGAGGTGSARNGGSSGGHHERSSRHHHPSNSSSGSQMGNHSGDGWEIRDNVDSLSHHSVPAWTTRSNHRNGGRRGGAGTNGGAGALGRDHDTLSDTMSHHSVQGVWPCRQPSGTASLRSQQSAGSMETVGGVSAISGGETVTTLTSSSNESGHTNTSQTPSCRALAGSLASFDTSSIVNTEGVPLLEENEMETEASNSSEQGDSGSATYSEASSKN